MNFENPSSNNFSENDSAPKEKSEKKKTSHLKKWIGVAAVGLAALAVEGCKKEAENQGQKVPEPIVQKESSRGVRRYNEAKKFNLETAKKVIDHERQIMRGEINGQNIDKDPFLQGYFWYLDNQGKVATQAEYEGSVELALVNGQNMRVLQIAFAKGIAIDLSKGLNVKMSCKGNVPVSAALNGVEVPISDSDYTDKEKELVKFWTQSSGQDSRSVEGKTSPPRKGTGSVRQGPDFDKDSDF